MDLTNTLLWTFSLILAVTGIGFGIIASYNSHKANQSVKDLIQSSWIADESEKLFFTNIKGLISKNQSVINALRNKTELTYKQYAVMASPTRLAPINERAREILSSTEFNELLSKYIEIKLNLEVKFAEALGSFKQLALRTKVPVKIKKALIDYHSNIPETVKSIITEYTTHIK